MTEPTFSERILASVPRNSGFRPYAIFDADGDTVEFVARPDEYYGERVDSFLTVYISERDGDIVGALVKDITRHMNDLRRRYPGFKLEIDDGRVRLDAVFLAQLWSQDIEPDGLPAIRYKRLIAVASATQTQMEISLV